MALLNPGDECLVFEPFYGYHVTTLLSQRIKPVVVPLDAPHWELDLDRLRAAITPRTRAIILNSPSNPSGKVFTLAETRSSSPSSPSSTTSSSSPTKCTSTSSTTAQRHISIATLPGMAERTVTISGFSKTFSVTGWRLGYLAADPRWTPAIGYFHDLTYVCAPAPLQHGAAAGLLELPESFYTDLAAEYQGKRDLLCTALTQAGLTPSIPTGAYYVLADATRIPGADAKAKARTLLAQTGLAAVAGTAFFSPKAAAKTSSASASPKKQSELEDAAQRLAGLTF